MNGAFGRWDWVVNGLLFGGYHLSQPWTILGSSILGAFFFALPTKRYRCAWFGILAHSGQSVYFLVLILGLVPELESCGWPRCRSEPHGGRGSPPRMQKRERQQTHPRQTEAARLRTSLLEQNGMKGRRRVGLRTRYATNGSQVCSYSSFRMGFSLIQVHHTPAGSVGSRGFARALTASLCLCDSGTRGMTIHVGPRNARESYGRFGPRIELGGFK